MSATHPGRFELHNVTPPTTNLSDICLPIPYTSSDSIIYARKETLLPKTSHNAEESRTDG